MAAPVWPPIAPEHPLRQLAQRLPAILASSGHSTLWGIHLSLPPPLDSPDAHHPPAPFPTLLVLQKYLRSTRNDVEAAARALEATLTWRREFGMDDRDRRAAAADGQHDERFDGLGYVSRVGGRVVTWNVYGRASKPGEAKRVFGDVDTFLRWRLALMERSIALFDLSNATAPIPDYGAGEDPYQGYQVHDYEGVSFLRMDADIRKASKEVVEVLQKHYPEWLSRKFFVSVPLALSFVFTLLRPLVSAETAKKFVVVSYKTNLCAELCGPNADARGEVPKAYGGASEMGLEELAL
ncbi:hypothetical protein JCM21900_005042 [Sporobolomyces salmonicolor]